MRVRLYRNLSAQYRQQHAWSLMAYEGKRKGLVIDIVDGAVLADAEFVVSEAGRQRVLRDKAKNVHAFVQGDLVKSYKLNTLPKDADGNDIAPGHAVDSRIGYDPYKLKKMIREDCQEPVEYSPLVVAAPRGVYAHFDEDCTGRGLRGLGAVDWTGPTDIDGWNG